MSAESVGKLLDHPCREAPATPVSRDRAAHFLVRADVVAAEEIDPAADVPRPDKRPIPTSRVWNLAKIVAVVGVAHDNESTASDSNACHQSVAVPFGRDFDDARSQPLSDGSGLIGAAVVGDYDFTADALLG